MRGIGCKNAFFLFKFLDNLEYIFGKLQFTVKTHENLTDGEMKELMRYYAQGVDHRNYDCFVCCILSHGAENQLYGVNGRLIDIKALTSCFKARNCPTLKTKPKLFFIQACQGKQKHSGKFLANFTKRFWYVV